MNSSRANAFSASQRRTSLRRVPALSATCRVSERWLGCFPIIALLGFLTWPASNADADNTEPVLSPAELKRMSLEQLLNVEVTTVSRQPAKWFDTPSAIQVITQEDIRRSGATSLPEALRLAPNLQVAQVSSSSWAISARGFNNGLANK